MTDNPTATKRQVNDVMREGLRRRAESEEIAFFCECAERSCYQAIWLTGSDYDRARSDPDWAARVPGHRAGIAEAADDAAAATPAETLPV